MPYASSGVAKPITVQNVVVSLTVDNNKPTAQSTITFTGKVTLDTTTPGGYRSVSLYIVHPTGTVIKLTSGTTASDGSFTYKWTIPWKVSSGTATYYVPCTTWRARLCDDATGVCSPDLNIAVAYPTALGISTDKDVYAPGDKIKVVANLVYANDVSSQNPLPGATVLIQLIDVSTGSTVATATATTDTNGLASTTFTAPSKTGSYNVQATFGGMGYAMPATMFRALSVSGARTLLAVAAAVALGALVVKVIR
jgi:uncharacterized protein YfaS (alpha-2-macroglobulin family)